MLIIAVPISVKAWWADGLLRFDDYPVAAEEEYFKALYSDIYEKYLWQKKLLDLTTTAVTALNTLDQNVRVAIEADRFLVYNNNSMIKSFKIPKEGKSYLKDWARFTVEVIVASRSQSQKIKALRAVDVHKIMTEAVMDTLDSFSHYIIREDTTDASEDFFAETGLRLKKTGRILEVVSIVAGSSAEDADINIGDFITHIDGEEISPMDSQMLIDRLNGKKGSFVKLTVVNHNSFVAEDVKLMRTKIAPSPIAAELKDDILFIVIYGFNKATAGAIKEAVFNATIAKDKDGNSTVKNLKGIVIDLRSNLGGIFEQAVETADLFLDNGPIVFARGRHDESFQYYEASKSVIVPTAIPMVVIIDGKTASSSEVLAAALQDNGRAVVAGTTSYGKGTIQTVMKLPDGNELSLTWSRFYAPSGYSLHSQGVLPSICYPDRSLAKDEDVITKTADNYKNISRKLYDWRRTNPDDKKLHQIQREICPPQIRFAEKDDLQLAKEIILNAEVYKKVIANSVFFISY